MEHGLHVVTLETAFVVRTFFFVIFGASIALASLLSFHVLFVSLALLGSVYMVRWLFLRLFIGKDLSPQLWIAPRGLITVLLFYAIPEAHTNTAFDSGILLFIIIATGLVMTGGLIAASSKTKSQNVKPVIPEMPFDKTPMPKLDSSENA